jgi:hypothetical protein
MSEIAMAASSRRKMLAAMGVGGLGAIVAGAAGSGAALLRGEGDSSSRSALPPIFLADGSFDHWQRAIGMSFAVAGSGALLTLTAVNKFNSPGKRPAEATRAEAFAAVFESEENVPIQGNRTYRMATRLAAPLDIHLGPRVASGGKSLFLAVFN